MKQIKSMQSIELKPSEHKLKLVFGIGCMRRADQYIANAFRRERRKLRKEEKKK